MLAVSGIFAFPRDDDDDDDDFMSLSLELDEEAGGETLPILILERFFGELRGFFFATP